MGAMEAAKKLFREELWAFLQNPHAEGDIRRTIHRLKGGAGLLQLTAIRAALIELQETVEANGSTSDLLKKIKVLHAEIS